MAEPVVTVVIPAYNAERFISEALDSIRGQMDAVEVLVVDDGSRDGTVKAAEAFAGAFDLTVLRQANGGPSAARNVAVRRARGRYCAFLDADDVMLPGRLAAQAALLDREADVSLVHTDLMTFDEHGIIHRTRRAFSEPCGGWIVDNLLLDNSITTSTVMARTAHLIDVGIFPLEHPISHDFKLWLRMAERWKVAFIDEPLIRYRHVASSVSANKLSSALDALSVVETYWREHPEHRRNRPAVYRRSMAAHLTVAGSAAAAKGQRGLALRFFVKALQHRPLTSRVWKSLVKAVLWPMSVLSGARPPVRTAGPA